MTPLDSLLRMMANDIVARKPVSAEELIDLLRRAAARINELEGEVRQHQLTLPLDS